MKSSLEARGTQRHLSTQTLLVFGALYLAVVLGSPIQSAAQPYVTPQSQITTAGENVSFNIIGSAGFPVIWLHEGTNINYCPDLIWNSWLNLTNVQTWNVGSYAAITPSWFQGPITSLPATLVVLPCAPKITGQPVGRSVGQGMSCTLSPTAKGSEPFSYQWQKDGIDLARATNSFLSLTNCQPGDSGHYRLLISNGLGSTNTDEAVITVGNLASWMVNATEQKETTDALRPPIGVTNVQAIVAASSVAAALDKEGVITVWGDWGDGATNSSIHVGNVAALSLGDNRLFALKTDGTIASWFHPSLWNADDSSQGAPPSEMRNIISVVGTYYSSVALKNDGTPVVFGGMTPPSGATNLVSLSTDGWEVLGLRGDGSVIAWSVDENDQSSREWMKGLHDVVDIAGVNLALKSDGTVVQWDSTGNFLPPPAGLTNMVAISSRDSHNMALRADGSVVEWSDSIFASSLSVSNCVGISAAGLVTIYYIPPPVCYHSFA